MRVIILSKFVNFTLMRVVMLSKFVHASHVLCVSATFYTESIDLQTAGSAKPSSTTYEAG